MKGAHSLPMHACMHVEDQMLWQADFGFGWHCMLVDCTPGSHCSLCKTDAFAMSTGTPLPSGS